MVFWRGLSLEDLSESLMIGNPPRHHLHGMKAHEAPSEAALQDSRFSLRESLSIVLPYINEVPRGVKSFLPTFERLQSRHRSLLSGFSTFQRKMSRPVAG